MNRITILALCAVGCSAAESGPDVKISHYETPDGLAAVDAVPDVVASAEVDGLRVEFLQVLTADEDNPGADKASLVMRQWRQMDGPDPIGELQQSEDVPLTFDEIYSGLTGEVAPDALLARHNYQAAALGRTFDYLRPVRIPLPLLAIRDKAITKASNAALFPDIPGHVHSQKLLRATGSMCTPWGITDCGPGLLIAQVYACTGGSTQIPMGGGVPGATTCPKVRGWIHMGFYNASPLFAGQTGLSGTAQEFYGPSTSGAWAAFTPFFVPPLGLFLEDWDAPAPKAIATLWSAPQNTSLWFQAGTSIVVAQ